MPVGDEANVFSRAKHCQRWMIDGRVKYKSDARHLPGTRPQRAARLSLALPDALSVVHFALLKTERIPEHVEHWAHQCRNVGSETVDVEFR